jgi:hypothetical protein
MPAVRDLKVDLLLLPKGDLAIAFCLEGQLDDLRIPPSLPRQPTDGLWKHSCFELFLMGDDGPAYREFNLSPSGAWAAHDYADYRQGGVPLDMTEPGIICTATPQALTLEAVIAAPALPQGAQLQVGLCAVIEDQQGALSYWALAHPSAKPDFHRSSGFQLHLDRAAACAIRT